MAEMLGEETLLQINPGRLIPLRATASAGSCEETAARLQTSSAVLELGKKLLQAAREGDTAVVLHLMSKGAPFTTDWLGTSPLHLAAMNAHVETCRVLLRAGISRDTRTKVERTPLHIAAYEGHTAVAELLLSHGAQPDSRDMLQMTPLHWAVEKGHAGCVRALLGAGADPRAVSKFLRTPHSLAAAAGRADLLLLMEEAELQREAERSAVPIQEPEVHLTEVEDDAVIEAAEEESGEVRAEEGAGATVADEESTQRAFAELLPQPSTECSTATAALLRRHGITMLPADNTSTVLSALRSGRTVVLSDAGKLMLKESNPIAAAARSVPTPYKLPPTPSPAPASAPAAPSTPAAPAAPSTPAAPPAKLARIFTLNGNQVVSMPRGTKLATANNIIKLPRAKIVKASAAGVGVGMGMGMGVASRLGNARGAIIKLNQLKSLQKEGVLGGGGGGGGAGGGGVRIVMHRNTLGRLVSAVGAAGAAGVGAGGAAPPPLPPLGERLAAAAAAAVEGGGGGGVATQLRAERDAARAALAEREREVRELRRRLLAYEAGAGAQ